MSLLDKLLVLLGFKPLTDVLVVVRRAPSSVDLLVERPRDMTLPRDLAESLELAVEASRGKVRVEEKITDKWVYQYPPPRLVVGGLLGGRLEFYGGIPDVLVGVLGEALLQASGAVGPECPRRVKPVKANVVLYVVAGIPCLRAGSLLVRLVRCWSELRAWVVEVKAYEKWFGKKPVEETPSLFVNGEYAASGAPSNLNALAKVIRESVEK